MEQKTEIFWVSAQHDSKLYRGALRNYYSCVCRYLEVKCGSKMVTLFLKPIDVLTSAFPMRNFMLRTRIS